MDSLTSRSSRGNGPSVRLRETLLGASSERFAENPLVCQSLSLTPHDADNAFAMNNDNEPLPSRGLSMAADDARRFTLAPPLSVSKTNGNRPHSSLSSFSYPHGTVPAGGVAALAGKGSDSNTPKSCSNSDSGSLRAPQKASRATGANTTRQGVYYHNVQCSNSTTALSDSNSQKQLHISSASPLDTTRAARMPCGSAASPILPGSGRGGAQGNPGQPSYTKFDFSTETWPSHDNLNGFDASTRIGSCREDDNDPHQEKLTATECAPYESDRVKRLRVHNCWLTAFIVLFAFFIALAGGLTVGFANKYFSHDTSKQALVKKNRIVLNSSVASLHNAEGRLELESANLFRYLTSRLKGTNYTTAKEMRNALLGDFMDSWKIWLMNSEQVDAFTMYVPFCDKADIGTPNCSTMVLVAACSPFYQRDYCYYARNSDDGLKLEVYDMPPNAGYEDGVFRGLIDMNVMFFEWQTGGSPFLLPPKLGPLIRDQQRYMITMRRQQYLANGQLAMCDTGTYMQTWFNIFSSTLQRSDNSYSMIFTSEGELLASQTGNGEQAQCFGTMHEVYECDNVSVMADMINAFLRDMPGPLLFANNTTSGQYSTTKTVNNYLTAYQDFMRFQGMNGEPNTIYFAAYGTPIDTSIGTDGVVQIVVCVAVIVICVLTLGLVAATAVDQMQKVIELVSRLATHASTYDTENMEKVLQSSRSAPQRCWGAILSSVMIEEEFYRILDNLKAYRPFLPPSLLTQGLAPYDEDTLVSIIMDDAEGRRDLADSTADRRRHGGFHDDGSDDETVVPLSAEFGANQASQNRISPGSFEATGSYHLPQSTHRQPRGGDAGHSKAGEKTSEDNVSLYCELPLMTPGGGRERRSLVAASDAGNAEGVSVGGITRCSDLEYVKSTSLNDRLRKGGLRLVRGTIMVVKLADLAIDAKDATEVINYYLGCVLARVKAANGVVDVMGPNTVIISFNCHFTVLRHQEKAVRCAISICDDFRINSFDFTVSIGIATGPLYVGTIGTETQRARVATGDSVSVAQRLSALAVTLGARILVTGAVAHASGSIACVPVDVVSIYRLSSRSWEEHDVCEVLGLSASSVTPAYSVAKKLFKLIRGRHLGSATAAVEAIRKAAEEKQESIEWCVERLMNVVANSPNLIKEGYRRRAVLWEYPEGVDVIMNHMKRSRKVLSSASVSPVASKVGNGRPSLTSGRAICGRSADEAKTRDVPTATATTTTTTAANPVLSAAALRGLQAAPERRFASSVPAAVQLVDETAKAKEMINEAQRTSASRHQLGDHTSAYYNEEETLFPVFFAVQQDEDEEDSSGSCPNTAAGTRQRQLMDRNEESEVIDTVAPPQTHDTATPSSSPCRSFRPEAPRPAPPSPSTVGAAPFRRLSHKVEVIQRNDGGDNGPSLAAAPLHLLLKAPQSTGSSAESNSAVVSPSGTAGVAVGSGSGGALSNLGRGANVVLITSVNGQSFYRTNELLGRGAFGDVYLAISESGVFVAMKAFPVDGFNAPQLIREVETLSKLRHDHIVAYDCCAVQDGQFFIMSEYMAAGSIRNLIKRLGSIPLPAVRKYSRDILYGLAYLHKNSWLHCDIKPDNILLTTEGTCKIGDFGAAALERSVGSGGVRGTPRFMAPEAVVGRWSTAADIYSFGLTLVTMLTGRQPWHAYAEPDHLFLAHLAGEVRHARENNVPCEMQPDLALGDIEDADMVHVIKRCCAFDPSERPTVEDLISMLL